MNELTKLLKPVIFASIFTMMGCAGGDEAAPSAAARVADSADTSTASSSSKSDDCYDNNLLLEDVLAAVNAARAQTQVCRGVTYPSAPPVSLDSRLVELAGDHSDDMAINNFFAHLSSSGLRVDQRADALGYDWLRIGENLAAGFLDVDDVVDAWIASSQGHCETLMSQSFVEIGASCKVDNDSDLSTYWSLVMGVER